MTYEPPPPQPPYAPYVPPPKPPKSGRPWWKAAWVGLVGALVVGLIIGGAAGASGSKTKTKTVAGPTVHVTSTVTASPTIIDSVIASVAVPGPTVTATVTVAAPAATVGPAAGGVTYKITATGSSEAGVITYTEDDSIEQQTDAHLPWTKTVADTNTLDQVSAQNSGSGTITCEIIGPDGTSADKHTASGAYAIASCQSQV